MAAKQYNAFTIDTTGGTGFDVALWSISEEGGWGYWLMASRVHRDALHAHTQDLLRRNIIYVGEARPSGSISPELSLILASGGLPLDALDMIQYLRFNTLWPDGDGVRILSWVSYKGQATLERVSALMSEASAAGYVRRATVAGYPFLNSLIPPDSRWFLTADHVKRLFLMEGLDLWPYGVAPSRVQH